MAIIDKTKPVFYLAILFCLLNKTGFSQIQSKKIFKIEVYTFNLYSFSSLPITQFSISELYEKKVFFTHSDTVNQIVSGINKIVKKLPFCDTCNFIETRILIKFRRKFKKPIIIGISRGARYLYINNPKITTYLPNTLYHEIQKLLPILNDYKLPEDL